MMHCENTKSKTRTVRWELAQANKAVKRYAGLLLCLMVLTFSACRENPTAQPTEAESNEAIATTVSSETESIQAATESAATEETDSAHEQTQETTEDSTQEEPKETTATPTEEPEATQATDSELEEDQLPIVPA